MLFRSLEEIVRLVGVESLSVKDRFTLETARSIREDYLHQNAFHEVDTYTSMDKQRMMLGLILEFHQLGQKALEEGVELSKIIKMDVREKIGRAKYIPEDRMKELEAISYEIKAQMEALMSEGVELYA